tara:strand:- start:146 stop:253 length:108 start_codon:yes stop_codon:yes gene_type:complete
MIELLILLISVPIIIYLIFQRMEEKKNETFEDRDN